MDNILQVVGLDPSMSNWGMVRGQINLDKGTFTPRTMLLTETTTSKKTKKVVRKSSDDLRRATTLFNDVTKFVYGADIIMVEVPHGSQNARAALGAGVCLGIIASISTTLIEVSALEVKVASYGKKTATKANMIKWAYDTYPNLAWLPGIKRGKNASKHPNFISNKNEHLADAIATVHAGVKTPQFKQLLTLYRIGKRDENSIRTK